MVSLALPMSRHFLSDSRSYSLHFVFVMPAGAPGAREISPLGVEAPEPGLEFEPLSNEEPVLRDPNVESRRWKQHGCLTFCSCFFCPVYLQATQKMILH
jgi:hypothetical protein